VLSESHWALAESWGITLGKVLRVYLQIRQSSAFWARKWFTDAFLNILIVGSCSHALRPIFGDRNCVPPELTPGLIVNIGVQSEVIIIGYLLSLE